MTDRRQQFQHNVEQSNVSSTSDVEMYSGQRQRFFARSPAMLGPHGISLERVEEEPSNMADSSTDANFKSKPNFYGSNSEQRYRSHDGPFKKPAQQGYYNCPITPPYYNNRYSCGNPMCRDVHYCYDHQGNRECFNPAIPMPPSQPHYFSHDCQASYTRQMHRASPLFINPNHPSVKRADHEARPKSEWPQGYRPGSHAQTPATPAQYLAALSGKESATIPPSTGTSLRSINLEPYMRHSNFSSPRQSARSNRKRAMSSSPLSIDSIDINSLIRTSPDSLIAYINAPRISSAGSYGHLSANGISPSPKPQRSPSMRSPFFSCWQRTPSATSRSKSQIDNIKEAKETNSGQTVKKEYSEKEVKQEPKEENMLVDNNNNVEEAKIMAVNSPTESDKKENFSDIENEDNNEPDKDENNNEFRCLWKDCNLLFQTQDELVKHVNTDHIKKERRDFTCYWIDCQREQKPFKAQYMLVVHMRRHTGEKPNKCPYEGCDKAYSRLENLKTHERSHTGERPYVCEFANCTKAFTNASDRAKHQNRTHSSVKPYICTVANCTKRYTDPSSLRKHKKTCHPEHFAGAKKAKIDEAKAKTDSSKGPSSTGKEGELRGKTNTQSGNGTQKTNDAANSSSPMENGAKQNVQGTNHANIQQIDFSPQSFQGDLTSSSSYVDSPQSNNFAADTGDQFDESPHGRSNRDNTQSKSPQAPGLQQFPERAEMGPRGGDVLVESSTIANQISLPTINKQNEVGKWIADVSQRMNNVSKYAGELRENPVADYSSRRSSESGVSSYISSRRSSEVSSHYNRPPYGSVQPRAEEILEEDYPPNRQANETHCMQKLPAISNKWKNNVFRNDDMSRPSPIPDTFDQRRSSSGYGSHHNLTIIRSPVFHKVPIQNSQQREPSNAQNRRMSDSVVCEADSSNRYMPLYTNNIVPRRSSEPARHYNTGGSNEFQMQNYPTRDHMQTTQMPHSDVYLNQRREAKTFNGQVAQPRVPQPLENGQKLTHYPYSIETGNQDYRTPHPPNYPHRNNGPSPARNLPQKSLWDYEQHINQQLSPLSEQRMQSQGFYQQNNTEMPAGDGALDVMVNGIGNLNTREIVEEAVLPDGPSNMVINDMNTLLNSLIEEDRYLEKKHGHETMTNALSHVF